jgi:glycosyltransferase involved in cell wall biosynthesis
MHGGPVAVHDRQALDELGALMGPVYCGQAFILPHPHFIGLAGSAPADMEAPVPGDGYVLFFGQVKKSKGLAVLLRAMQQVPAGRLVVAGPPRDVSPRALRRLIEKEGPAGRVTVVNRFIEAGERDALFRNAAVVAIPYLRGYQSGVLVTAMSSGKAVAASGIAAHRALIADGRNGLLFPPGDAGALAAGLNRLLGDEPLRRALGTGALATMREKYGCDALHALYHRLPAP